MRRKLTPYTFLQTMDRLRDAAHWLLRVIRPRRASLFLQIVSSLKRIPCCASFSESVIGLQSDIFRRFNKETRTRKPVTTYRILSSVSYTIQRMTSFPHLICRNTREVSLRVPNHQNLRLRIPLPLQAWFRRAVVPFGARGGCS